MPYTNKTARYDQDHDDDRSGPVVLGQVAALVTMAAFVWYLDATYNQATMVEGLMAMAGF